MGCSAPTYPAMGLSITIERDSILMAGRYGTDVAYTIVNTSGRSVRLAGCDTFIQHRMEKLEAGNWVDATRAFCGDTLHAIVLGPGDTTQGWVNPIVVGKYRARIAVFVGRSTVSYSRETSNTFEAY